MDKDAAEYVGGEVKQTEEGASFKEVVEEVAVHMKMGLMYQMSPITLKMKSGPQSQT